MGSKMVAEEKVTASIVALVVLFVVIFPREEYGECLCFYIIVDDIVCVKVCDQKIYPLSSVKFILKGFPDFTNLASKPYVYSTCCVYT